jgi:hypothetical protein
VHDIEIKDEPFEKTPKKSIKRFLYKWCYIGLFRL